MNFLYFNPAIIRNQIRYINYCKSGYCFVNNRTTDSLHEAISTKTSQSDWSLKNT